MKFIHLYDVNPAPAAAECNPAAGLKPERDETESTELTNFSREKANLRRAAPNSDAIASTFGIDGLPEKNSVNSVKKSH